MHYEDMNLEVSEFMTRTEDDRRLGTFKVRVLQSPAGEMAPGEAVMVEYDDKDLQSSLGKLDRRELDAAGLIAIGRALAALLLPIATKDNAASVRELFARSLVEVGPDGGLRLRLRLPGDLAVVPWEYVYVERAGGEGMDGFLALDPRIAIVRHEVLASPSTETLLTGDIKVVTALAAAEGLPELKLDDEMKFLNEALSGLEGIQLQFCQHATLKKLQPLLPGAGVFHFAGHGDFTREMGARLGTYTGIGYLAFEDERVDAAQLGINLRGHGVRLAVLAGCHTGRRDGISVWSGIAPALVKAEIPAVVANQYTILDKCAVEFSRQFYQALAGGLPIERAVSAGRIAAYNADKGGRDWGVPVLYLRAADGLLFTGAADPQARKRCKEAAEVDVKVRASEIKAGGALVGADVHRMVDGKLAVAVRVSSMVAGKLVAARLGSLAGGSLGAQVDVEEVKGGGCVTAVEIGTLGGGDPAPGNLVHVGSVGTGSKGTAIKADTADFASGGRSAAAQPARIAVGDAKLPVGTTHTASAQLNVRGGVSGGKVIGTQINVLLGHFFERFRRGQVSERILLLAAFVVLAVLVFVERLALMPGVPRDLLPAVGSVAWLGALFLSWRLNSSRGAGERPRWLVFAVAATMLYAAGAGWSIYDQHFRRTYPPSKQNIGVSFRALIGSPARAATSDPQFMIESFYLDDKRSNFEETSSVLFGMGPKYYRTFEADMTVLDAFRRGQCVGPSGQKPMRAVLPVMRRHIEQRGQAQYLRFLERPEDLSRVMRERGDVFEKVMFSSGELQTMKNNAPGDYEITKEWLLSCVGVYQPVLTLVLRNVSNDELLVTEVVYDVLDVGTVRGGVTGPIYPEIIYDHTIQHRVGLQRHRLNPPMVVPPHERKSFSVRLSSAEQGSGLAWLMRIMIKNSNGEERATEEFQLIMSK